MLTYCQGFSNPTKSERRFFQTRLRELENEGFLEIVQVRGPKHPTKCVRLLNQEKNDDEPKPSEEAIESEASDDRGTCWTTRQMPVSPTYILS